LGCSMANNVQRQKVSASGYWAARVDREPDSAWSADIPGTLFKREFRRPELKPTAPGRESVLKFSRHSMLLVVSMPTPGARSEASVGQAVLGGRRRSDRSARPAGRRSRRHGHRLDSHRFVADEYVCICGDAGPPHTFKIAEIRPAGSSNQGVASEVLLRRGKLALAVRRMQG